MMTIIFDVKDLKEIGKNNRSKKLGFVMLKNNIVMNLYDKNGNQFESLEISNKYFTRLINVYNMNKKERKNG